MKFTFHTIHAYFLHPLLHIFPFFWIDPFQQNLSDLSVVHPFYLYAWAISTAYGFWYYSSQIWNGYATKKHQMILKITTSAMFLSCMIPYDPFHSSIWNEIHIWMAIASTCTFLFQWILISLPLFNKPFLYQKYARLLFLSSLISLSLFLCLGHVTAICELSFSLLFFLILVQWDNNKKRDDFTIIS